LKPSTCRSAVVFCSSLFSRYLFFVFVLVGDWHGADGALDHHPSFKFSLPWAMSALALVAKKSHSRITWADSACKIVRCIELWCEQVWSQKTIGKLNWTWMNNDVSRMLVHLRYFYSQGGLLLAHASDMQTHRFHIINVIWAIDKANVQVQVGIYIAMLSGDSRHILIYKWAMSTSWHRQLMLTRVLAMAFGPGLKSST
jgi:hypothetical protein